MSSFGTASACLERTGTVYNFSLIENKLSGAGTMQWKNAFTFPAPRADCTLCLLYWPASLVCVDARSALCLWLHTNTGVTECAELLVLTAATTTRVSDSVCVTCVVVMTGTPPMISVLVETCFTAPCCSWGASARVVGPSHFFGT